MMSLCLEEGPLENPSPPMEEAQLRHRLKSNSSQAVARQVPLALPSTRRIGSAAAKETRLGQHRQESWGEGGWQVKLEPCRSRRVAAR